MKSSNNVYCLSKASARESARKCAKLRESARTHQKTPIFSAYFSHTFAHSFKNLTISFNRKNPSTVNLSVGSLNSQASLRLPQSQCSTDIG